MANICKKCNWCENNVGIINVFGNVLLIIVKIIGGILGRSQALIADAFHSAGDIFISLFLLVSLKISDTPPDEDHHWGHGHIEFIVSAVIGILLLFIAAMIVVSAVASIIDGEYSLPGLLAIWAAIISIVLNEILFRHSLCIGKQSNSPAIVANAWEKRADVYSSVAALVGVVGAKLGFPLLDPIAALIVAFMIAKSATQSLITGIYGIADRTVEDDELLNIRKVFLREKGMKSIANIRARRIGKKTWIDAEIKFNPETKVFEVKETIKRIKENILLEFETIGGVHIISRVTMK